MGTEERIQAPLDTIDRRGTIMTEMTLQTDARMDFNESSEDFGEHENPPWVDRVKLRHGMDWLDLIKDEVDKNAFSQSQGDSSLRRTVKTEQTR